MPEITTPVLPAADLGIGSHGVFLLV